VELVLSFAISRRWPVCAGGVDLIYPGIWIEVTSMEHYVAEVKTCWRTCQAPSKLSDTV